MAQAAPKPQAQKPQTPLAAPLSTARPAPIYTDYASI